MLEFTSHISTSRDCPAHLWHCIRISDVDLGGLSQIGEWLLALLFHGWVLASWWWDFDIDVASFQVMEIGVGLSNGMMNRDFKQS